MEDEVLKNAAQAGDLHAVTLMGAKKSKEKETLKRKAQSGDPKAIKQLSDIKHQQQSRVTDRISQIFTKQFERKKLLSSSSWRVLETVTLAKS